jgi:hypothetical protein
VEGQCRLLALLSRPSESSIDVGSTAASGGNPDIEPTSAKDRVDPKQSFGAFTRFAYRPLDRPTEEWYHPSVA